MSALKPLVAKFTEPIADGDSVLYVGKIFEAGEYPDKQFTITEDELAQAAAEFSPVNNDLEHVPSILDGRLGKLETVEVSEDRKSLLGKIRVPAWLSKLLGEEPLKASLAWDRDSKRIVGNAIVRHPRIADASLLAAFSASKPADDIPQLMSKETTLKSFFSSIAAMFGADPETPPAITSNEEEDSSNTPPAGGDDDLKTKFAALEQERDELKSRLEKIESRLAGGEGELDPDKRVAQAASEFADQMIKDNKAVPAQKESLAALFKVLASRTEAKFSAGGQYVENEDVKLLRSLFKDGLSHALGSEKISAHFQGTEQDDQTELTDELKRLLGKTALGRAALKDLKEGK